MLRLPRSLEKLKSVPYSIYLVGGPVRDLIMGRDCRDFDFLIEGGEEDYHKARSALLEIFPPQKNSFKEFPQFFTTRWQTKNGWHVDCARPRVESYPRSGALPQTRLAVSALEDLGRRDFSINGMALGVTSSNKGEILDPFSGQKDLRLRLLRVLHEKSFEDDPTRLLRSARFAARFNFQMAPDTAVLFKEALKTDCLGTVSWERKRDELIKAFAEHNWPKVLDTFFQRGFFGDFLPKVQPPYMLKKSLFNANTHQRLASFYAHLIIQAKQKPRPAWSSLPWPAREIKIALKNLEDIAQCQWRPSRKISPLALKALRAAAPSLGRVFAQENPMLIRGDDLIRLGVPAPARSQLQNDLATLILKGEITNRQEALKWLARP